MRKIKQYHRYLAFSIIFLMLISIVGCQNEQASTKEEIAQGETNEVEEDIIAVEVEKVHIGPIKTSFMALGTVEPGDRQSIFALGPGEVEEVYVSVGDYVNKGDRLFKLESKALSNNYNVVERQLRSVYENLEIQIADLEKQLEDAIKLYEKGVIPKSQVEALENQLEILQAQYQSSVDQYYLQLNQLQQNINDTLVTSDISGKVAAVYIEKNQFVSNTPAIDIINTTTFYADVLVTSGHLDQIGIGTRANIYYNGDLDKHLTGRVSKINEVMQNNTGLYPVEISIESLPTDYTLRQGEFARVDIITQDREGVVISQRSVLIEEGQTYVYKVENNVATKQVVQLGDKTGDYVEVLQGLGVGQLVITSGKTYVESGDTVLVVD